jgi:predicted phosphodiesterase
MNTSRRAFLAGAAAFGFGGWRLFAAPPGWKHGGKPNLILGVLADTHLRTSPVKGDVLDKAWPGRYFEAALKCFRERNVDAVIHCGDFAHLGQVFELKAHADIWRKVFPGNRASDGHEVARLFVTGNHEFCSHIGGGNGTFVRRLYPDKDKWNEAVLRVDTAQKWQRIWGEEYKEVWHREVKGFHFFGWQYGADLGKMASLLDESIETYGLDKSSKPFFFIGHVPEWHPKELIGVLKRHGCRNSVAFYGHNHYSAANMNTFANCTDMFTSINVPCCAPWYGAVLLHDENIAAARIEDRENAQKPHSRQGLVVSLYDDMMVVERHEFGEGGKLGRDIVMPLGKHKPHPFSKDELKKVIGEPKFPAKAKLVVKVGMASVATEDTKNADVNKKSQTKKVSAVKVSIPLADGNPDSRVYAYEVEVTGDEGTPKLRKAVYAVGCNMGIGHEPNGGVTTLEIPKSELPTGKTLTVAVRPLTSLGTAGKAIATEFKV